MLLAAPVHHLALDKRDESVAGETDGADDDDPGEDIRGAEEAAGIEDHKAEPAVAAQQFRCDEDRQRRPHGDAEPRHDLRQRGGQDHEAEGLHRIRAHRAGGAHGVEGGRLSARVCAHHHDEKYRNEDEQDLGQLADPEPEDEKRNETERRDRPDHFRGDEEHRVEKWYPAPDEADDGAEDRAQHESDGDARQARADVGAEGDARVAALKHVHQAGEDGFRRRENDGCHGLLMRDESPKRQDRQRRQDRDDQIRALLLGHQGAPASDARGPRFRMRR